MKNKFGLNPIWISSNLILSELVDSVWIETGLIQSLILNDYLPQFVM
jgi:hypothetical protein